MTSLGLCLLWSSLQATLIGIVAILLGARPWRIGGSFTPLVALLAMAILTLCSLLPLPGWWPEVQVSRAALPKPSQQTASSSLTVADTSVATAAAELPTTDHVPNPTHALIDFANGFIDELKSVRTEDAKRWQGSSLPAWVISIFAIGIALGLIRLTLGVLGAREIRRQSQLLQNKNLNELLDILQAELRLRQGVELRQANALTTAATIGYRSPVILLPPHWPSWQEHELRAVLSHELAHIQHRDFAAQLCSQLGLILHFYNPIVHWLSDRMKLEQELAADAIAAQLTGGQRDYLRVLATLAIDHDNQTVGWPARAFLPTRNSFLRRLEMLRVSKALSAGSSLPGRMCVLVLIATLTLGLISLRPEASLPSAQASGGVAITVPTENAGASPSDSVVETVVVQEPANANAATSNYELRYLGEDVELVAGARPAELLNNPQLKRVFDFGKGYTKVLKQGNGFDIEEVEQIVYGTGLQPEAPGAISCFVKLTKARRISADMVNGKAIDIKGRAVIEMPQGLVLWQPDDRSIVMNTRSRVEKFIDNRFAQNAFTESKAWAKLGKEDAFVLVSGKLVRKQWEAAGAAQLIPDKAMVQTAGIIVDEAAYVGLCATFKKDMRMAMFVECQDAMGSKRVVEAASQGVSMLRKSLQDLARSLESSAKQDTAQQGSLSGQLIGFAQKALDNIQSQADGQLVTLTTRVTESEFPGEFLSSVTGAARRAAARQTSMTNMKQIGLAIHKYHETNQALPQSATTVANEKSKQEPKKYPYSWRVAILPWLDKNALYNKYKFDEPWDSPSNQEVLMQMPDIFRYPDAPADSTNTSYVILVGEATMFPPNRLAKFADINDGTADTIMVVEAKTSIPWTKPEDFDYATDKPLPSLGGYASEGYNVLFADGTVRFFGKTLDESLLRKLITARGGEKIK